MGPMNDLNVLIEQMAANISSKAMRLDDLRLKLFLEWLYAHSTKVKSAAYPEAQALQPIQIDDASLQEGSMEEQLNTGLRTWFDALRAQEMLWEYCLILNEIAWCRGLDARRLIMILKSEAGK